MDSSTTVHAAGTLLHVDDTGEPDLPPIVCLHSLFFDNRMFDQFTRAAASMFRVIRPDYRSQGRSAAADGGVVTVDQCAGDIAALMDSLQVSHAHLLGTSMGGDIGLRLAVNRPDLVRSMALLGSSARAEPADKVAAFMGLADEFEEHGFTGERLDFMLQVMFGASTLGNPAMKETVELWKQRMAELPATLKPAIVGVIKRRDATAMLPDVRVPALVISGEECPVRPPEWARGLADGLPDSELVMLPKVGHSPILEAPDAVIPRVLDFFAVHNA
ncbi:alpha/beta hydrolase [Streptomyces sp. NPDC001928]|uniref:alpha/beta fold hydrolase n=1 Tax=Streptomyces sp. NPDC001928 TaxID=3154404 RepID=UPI00332AF95F